MKRPRGGSTIKQFAYARKLFNGDGKSKKDIALSVNFATSVANNAKSKIEDTEGFHNAMQKLAVESNNLVLAAMEEYKARGLSGFSNKDLNGALNAIASAWSRIAKERSPNGEEADKGNLLRKVYIAKVENKTINNITPTPVVATPIEKEEEIDMDF